MPYTYNGCGTRYYGKKNLQTYQGVCGSCGRPGTLRAYDTGLYIVVLLVPVFPLGRKRVIDECSCCGRHRVMSLAECLMRQGRPQEAEELLSHIVEQGIPDRVDALFALAQTWQIRGKHDKALEVFGQCEGVHPAIAQDAMFQQLKAESEKKRGTRTAVRPGEVAQKEQAKAKGRKLLKAVAALVPFAFLLYCIIAWYVGEHRSAFLVSGVGRPYTVRINGQSYKVSPHSITTIQVREGEVSVELIDPPGLLPEEKVTIATSFILRPIASHSIVLNPDGAAVIAHVNQLYVVDDHIKPAPDPEVKLAARIMHHYQDIDCPFKTMPESIEAGSRTHVEALILLGSGSKVSPEALMRGVADELGNATAAAVARRHLLLEPEEAGFRAVLQDLMAPAELADFLRPHLSRRPLQMQWHQTYQDAMGRAGRDEQLQTEYREMLAKEPAIAEMLYLAGRATWDPDEAAALFNRSALAERACPYAFYALAMHETANAQFRDAAEHALKAGQLLPGDREVQHGCEHVLLADGRLDKAMEMVRSEQGHVLGHVLKRGWWSPSERAYIHTLKGERTEARQVLLGLREQLKQAELKQATREHLGRVIDELQAFTDYAAGDTTKSADVLTKSDQAELRLAGRIIKGEEISVPDQDLAAAKPEAYWHALLFISATRRGRVDVAQQHLKAVTEHLSKGRYGERAFAAALSGKPVLPLDKLLRLGHSAMHKPVYLVALGLADPSSREACFALAAKLNFDKRFPHLLLQEAMGQ